MFLFAQLPLQVKGLMLQRCDVQIGASSFRRVKYLDRIRILEHRTPLSLECLKAAYSFHATY